MEIKLLPCPLCQKPHFDGVDSLRSSLISVATSQLTCPVCSETLLGLDKLTIHLFSHVQETNAHPQTQTNETTVIANETEKPPIYCDICNFCFTDENILDMHQKLLHQTTPDKKTGQYSYHCHLCSKKFKMRGSLMVHLRVAHYGFGHHEKVAHSDLALPAEECDRKGKVQDNKQWECDACSKMFTTKYFLKKHKRLHTGEMPYYCAQCNKSFTFQQSYHKHMLYHSADKPHVCNECGRAFKELSTLHNHERIHSGERPFACESCGKCFRQRVSYLVHRRIHTGAMPYKCTACDKNFRYKVSLRSHKCAKVAEATNQIEATVVTTQNQFNMTEIVAPNVEQLNAEYIERINSVKDCEFDGKNTDDSVMDGSAESHNDVTITYSGNSSDMFSMVMSPLLPNVESLCLSADNDENREVLHTINEESLKELLYGPCKSNE